MLALKDDAIDPTTHKPYIMSAKGGREDTINMFKIAVCFVLTVLQDRFYSASETSLLLFF